MNNVETRIIRHDPPSFAFYVYVMLITMRARNFCLQLDRKLANWLPIYPTGIYGSRFESTFIQRGGIFPRCLHRGKFRFFNLGYVRERLCRKRYRPLWWRHLSRKWGTKPPSCTQESAMIRGGFVGFIPFYLRRSIKYLSAPHALLSPSFPLVYHSYFTFEALIDFPLTKMQF